MMNFDNSMRRQVFSLTELIRQQYRDLEPKVRKALTTPEIFSMQRIIITGCGDSYAAALAARYAFERLTGIPTEVVPAIELSRQYSGKQLGFSPDNPFVFAVSNSGKVARVSEAIERASLCGAFTFAVTGNAESVLAKNAKRILNLDTPPFESAPGTRSYLVAVLVLILIAIRIGEVRGCYTMDTANVYRKEIPDLAGRLEASLLEMDEKALQLSGLWKKMEAFDFVGSGQDYGAAWFGHAKIFEAVGCYAMHINTEEWLHLNCFMRKFEKIATVVIYSNGNDAKSRTVEMLSHAAGMGRSILVITDTPKDIPVSNIQYIAVPQTSLKYLQPLVQFIPVCLLAGYIGAMLGEKDGRGCEGPWKFCENAAAIYNSEKVII